MLRDRQRGLFINLLGAGLLSSAAIAEEITIVALGDSLTQGFGLPAEQGFVPQLQAYLDAAGAQVSVINAGVSGDTTAGGLSRIDWTLSDEIDGIIVALGGNDALRGLPVDAARANLDGILAKVATRDIPALLIGIDVPSNFGPEYATSFGSIYPELAQKYHTLLVSNFLDGLAQKGDLGTVSRQYMQPDGIHPNAEGVAVIVSTIGPHVLELVDLAKP